MLVWPAATRARPCAISVCVFGHGQLRNCSSDAPSAIAVETSSVTSTISNTPTRPA